MSPNICILGLGAFGFAIARYLGELHPQIHIHACEKNENIIQHIQETRRHPYFFQDIPNAELPNNISVISTDHIQDILASTDILIAIIPHQFFAVSFQEIAPYIRDHTCIVNLSKGIAIENRQSASQQLATCLTRPYTYAYFAGGMIAEDVVQGHHLGANIITKHHASGEQLQDIFQSPKLDIVLRIEDPYTAEVSSALKNIIALLLGYYEGQGVSVSSLGYYFSCLLQEYKYIITLLQNDAGIYDHHSIPFTDFYISGDLIATCFGASRNRYLGNMLGKGIPLQDALNTLKKENKISEGYMTLMAILPHIQEKIHIPKIHAFCKKYI